MRGPAAAGLALLLATWLVAPAVGAAIPTAEKIRRAVAQANRTAGRGQALTLPVTLLFDEEGAPAATGTLLADPSGLARLELTSRTGFIERHLLRAGRIQVSRDGAPLEDARPFLPPLQLLLARSGDAFAAGVAALGARAEEVELGYAGARNCYVLGGRREGAASVWVDQESLQVVRVQRADGVRFEWGPVAEEGKVRVPAWVEIHEPGVRTARLVFGPATPKRPEPDAFRPEWLRAR